MTLRFLYRAVAAGTLSTLGAEFALSIFSAVSGYDPMSALARWPGLIWPPLAALIRFLTTGGSVLWLGMMRDCAIASEMSFKSKVLWLILVIPTPYLGALIYYFCVFRCRPLRLVLSSSGREAISDLPPTILSTIASIRAFTDGGIRC